MKKVIFLHGFFASGSCPLAMTLKDELESRALGPQFRFANESKY
jgi:hypothetical protein